MARRGYVIQRTEEEKRNLKVDLSCVPDWEAELKGILELFGRFDLAKVVSSATLIQEISDKMYPFRIEKISDKAHPLRNTSLYREQNREALERWKWKLTIDRLIHVSIGHSAPEFLRAGVKDNVVEEIRSSIESSLRETEKYLAECLAKGVTDSFWVSMFTSKVDSDTVRRLELVKAEKIVLLAEIPKIEEALRLLAEVLLASRQYSARVGELNTMLSLAAQKKASIERFEAKHGKALAKAAAANNHTRGRAESIRHLVKKTKECPYCGDGLGETPHLDHIYPVSKGGLSIVENLVWCCSTCNGLKTDKGLTQFLNERGIAIEQALSRLHSLGKHV